MQPTTSQPFFYSHANMEQNTKIVYIYSTASVIIISIVSLLGAAISEKLMSCFGRRELWLQGFFALTVAVLSADSLLHLIPRAINGYPDEHIHILSNSTYSTLPPITNNSNQEYLVRMVLLFAIVYMLYMFELITQSLRGIIDGHTTASQSHHHGREGRDEYSKKSYRHKSFTGSLCTFQQTMTAVSLIPKDIAANDSPVNGCNTNNRSDESVNTIARARSDSHWLRCLTIFDPIVAIIFLGDAVHNFADGLEIGVSFTRSIWTGFSASLVVVCHEMPHEIGDYIDLRESGLSVGQALAVNGVSSFAGFIGLYVGLSIGHLQNARPWLFAITAGMFLYLAWVHILPHLKSIDISEQVLQGLCVQTLGFVIGYGVIFILVWYEKDLQL